MIDVSFWQEALRQARIIDLTQTLEEHIPHYPTHSKFFHQMWTSYWHGDRSLTYQLILNEHNGTHVDAPAHFIRDESPGAHLTIDHVPVRQLLARAARLDCLSFGEGNSVSRNFITGWEAGHGALQEGDVVLFNFGWAKRWGLRPEHASYVNDWPGVSLDAAEYLIERKVAAFGVDTLSPDPPATPSGALVHPVVLAKHVLIVENLCNLEELPDFSLFLALPLKIRAGSGSPIRAVALV